MEIPEQNKYLGGKIYTIRSPHTDKYYIGSTIEKYLSSRLNGHKRSYKQFLNGKIYKYTSFDIIKLGDSYIELLEAFPCNNKLELHKREGELIREYKEHCINKKIEGRTDKKYYEDNKEKYKEYYKQNFDSIKIRKNLYYERTKESKKEQEKKYRDMNKDKRKEYNKIYNELNKEKLKVNQKLYYQKKKLATTLGDHISN